MDRSAGPGLRLALPLLLQYVRAPFLEGIRLDTVIRQADGDFLYEYTQTIRTRPKLKKVEVVLTGDIFQEDQRLYTMPQTEPVSFYVSSLSDLSDGTERYVTRVVERRATSHTACRLAFRSGKADIDLRLEDNSIQMAHLRRLLPGRCHPLLDPLQGPHQEARCRRVGPCFANN